MAGGCELHSLERKKETLGQRAESDAE
jgi:hypothetical protein